MHPINEFLDRHEPKLKCNKECRYYRFPELEVACVLSEVYSVRKGQQCAAHTKLEDKEL